MIDDNIFGAILAGEQPKAMCKDKLFLQLNGKTFIERTIDKVKKYLQKVIIIKNLEFKFKDYDQFLNINTLEDLEFAKQLSLKSKNDKKQ